ncbi:hypothetical protein BTS2_1370 [Bacillus sp. TS-2]|nr:hypothetical protein BTS2_1370 [Bacillus sp. TS-2]
MTRNERIGSVFLLTGALLFGLIHLAVAIYTSNQINLSSGGLFETLVAINGFFPYILSFIFLIAGIVLIFTRNLESMTEKTKNNMERNEMI